VPYLSDNSAARSIAKALSIGCRICIAPSTFFASSKLYIGHLAPEKRHLMQSGVGTRLRSLFAPAWGMPLLIRVLNVKEILMIQ
jgi:hypothetical protein